MPASAAALGSLSAWALAGLVTVELGGTGPGLDGAMTAGGVALGGDAGRGVRARLPAWVVGLYELAANAGAQL